MTEVAKLSPIEDLKTASRFLRGSLAEELQSPEPGFSADSQQLVKLHGMYQQKDRDRAKSGGSEPTLLLRGRIPGGRLNAEQYLAWDHLADAFGDATLRITTRQSFELHGLAKGNLKAVIQAIHAVQLTSQGACGDVVRNVTQAVNPLGRADLAQLDAVADLLSEHFKAKSNAYLEIWLDGEPVEVAKESEPILGPTYLPRKFKMALTLAGENTIDVLSNDLGLAATLGPDGKIDGYFVLVGGGQGQSITDPTTFARLADNLGWVPASALLPITEAVVTAFRDLGNRSDRKRARLKYLIHGMGLDAFRAEVERRTGLAFDSRPLPEWKTPSVLGWQQRVDGTWALGLHVLSGRLLTEARRGLAQVIRDHQLQVQLTTDQDLILLRVAESAKGQVDEVLKAHGLQTDRPNALRQKALACVALPLCSLAITEAERVLPEFISALEASLDRHGLSNRAPVFRMTGCGNGCARPYNAELALVGQGVDKYAIFAGGHPEGTRLAFQIAERVPKAEVAAMLDPIFARWASEGGSDSFGEFTHKLGAEGVKALLG